MSMGFEILETSRDGCEIFTIGHSNHSVDRFIDLLRNVGITAVADVRSVPYSRRMPQFCRPELKYALSNASIAYVFLGDRLGARPKDKSCYRNGVADYDLIAATQDFQEGIKRVEKGAESYCITLMCAEREPLDCHRTVLVSRWLQKRGATIRHILADGSIEPNEETEKRLVKLMKLDIGDLFTSPRDDADPVAQAYVKRGREIAYTEERETGEEMVERITIL